MKYFIRYKDFLWILLVGIVFFVPFLGRVHLFDWDEINFAESAREMLLTHDYFRVQINFQPFWEKPPLFIWLQALSMKVFGVNEYAARFPNALAGIATLLLVFSIGKKHFGREFGWWWVIVYLGSFLPHLYFKSGIIDPLFNLFIFLGVYFLAEFSVLEKDNSKRHVKIVLSGIFIGLAVLTKGPVALLIVILCTLVYCIIQWSLFFTVKEIILFSLPVFILSFAWFGVETLKHGPWFLQAFIVYQIRLFQTQDAGHGGPFFYHFIVLYLGCFPASIFIFKSFGKRNSDTAVQHALKIWCIISFFVVLLLFSIVKTKIVHYSSFCYFPLTFLSAYAICRMRTESFKLPRSIKWQIAVVGGLIALLLCAFPLVLKNIDPLLASYSYLIRDEFVLANMKAKVYWNGYECLIGLFYMICIFIILIRNIDLTRRISLLFVSTAIVIGGTLLIIVPKIEKYSQGAAIEFYESFQNKDVYVDVYGFKSYAQLFYTKKKPIKDTLSIHLDHLVNGPVDKDVYLVSKINNINLSHVPSFEKLGEKNGFVFYYRKKVE
jgi:4-amino-4-deoxy-L-arabinose transferase-like glycosyltransferase